MVSEKVSPGGNLFFCVLLKDAVEGCRRRMPSKDAVEGYCRRILSKDAIKGLSKLRVLCQGSVRNG
jgi:hypothetical protein